MALNINPLNRVEGISALRRWWDTVRGRCWSCGRCRADRFVFCDRSRFHNGQFVTD